MINIHEKKRKWSKIRTQPAHPTTSCQKKKQIVVFFFYICQDNIPIGKRTYILAGDFPYNSGSTTSSVYNQSHAQNVLGFWYPDSKRSWDTKKKTFLLWVMGWSEIQLACILLLALQFIPFTRRFICTWVSYLYDGK